MEFRGLLLYSGRSIIACVRLRAVRGGLANLASRPRASPLSASLPSLAGEDVRRSVSSALWESEYLDVERRSVIKNEDVSVQ